MLPITDDVFTEPEDVSPDTLANLGPLRRLAGIWQSDKGVDVSPKADGPERSARRRSSRKRFAPTITASTSLSTTTAAGPI
jgi:hypothetical protein